jgi:hypothetical protein
MSVRRGYPSAGGGLPAPNFGRNQLEVLDWPFVVGKSRAGGAFGLEAVRDVVGADTADGGR